MNINFYTDRNVPNYLDEPDYYKYLQGSVSATAYLYWILKNFGYSNIKLIRSCEETVEGEPVVFHWDHLSSIDLKKNQGIQVVSDRPPVEGCVIYFYCNPSFKKRLYVKESINNFGVDSYIRPWVTSDWFYMPYPFTFGMKKCYANFPPKVYAYAGREHTLLKDIKDSSFVKDMKSLGIELRFYFDRDNNLGDEDVWFCVRNPKHISTKVLHNNIDGYYGHKHPGRAYQAWYMNVPSIFETNTAMASVKKSQYDFLEANSVEEFRDSVLRLRDDKDLFFKMISQAKSREAEGSYLNLINYFKVALESKGLPTVDLKLRNNCK